MQGLHSLLERGVIIKTVDLQQIDVVGVEAGERVVDLVEDRRARQEAAVNVVLGARERVAVQVVPHLGLLADPPVALGHDDHLVARDVVVLERPPHDPLARPVRVHVRRVPRVEPAVVGRFQQRQGLVGWLAE